MLKNMKSFYCSYISKENKIRVTDMIDEVFVDIEINDKNSSLSFVRIVEDYMDSISIEVTHFSDIYKNGEASNDFIVFTDQISAIIKIDENASKEFSKDFLVENKTIVKNNDSCTCKQDIESRLFKEVSEKEPSKHLLSASLQGYSIIFEPDENGITCGKLRPTNTVELVFEHPKDRFKRKKEKTNMIGSYCPFCGTKFTK